MEQNNLQIYNILESTDNTYKAYLKIVEYYNDSAYQLEDAIYTEGILNVFGKLFSAIKQMLGGSFKFIQKTFRKTMYTAGKILSKVKLPANTVKNLTFNSLLKLSNKIPQLQPLVTKIIPMLNNTINKIYKGFDPVINIWNRLLKMVKSISKRAGRMVGKTTPSTSRAIGAVQRSIGGVARNRGFISTHKKAIGYAVGTGAAVAGGTAIANYYAKKKAFLAATNGSVISLPAIKLLLAGKITVSQFASQSLNAISGLMKTFVASLKIMGRQIFSELIPAVGDSPNKVLLKDIGAMSISSLAIGASMSIIWSVTKIVKDVVFGVKSYANNAKALNSLLHAKKKQLIQIKQQHKNQQNVEA